MSEDLLRELKKLREEQEKKYIEFKGMLKGISLAQLSQIDKSMLKIVERMVDGFKSVGDNLSMLMEGEIHLLQRLENLEKIVTQLRETLDTLSENR